MANKKKLRIGVLFGGRSGEHEVSLLSAASILKAIDRRRYDVVPIAITKQGQWLGNDAAQALLSGSPPATLQLAASSAELVQQSANLTGGLDVIFPVLHGTLRRGRNHPGTVGSSPTSPTSAPGVLGSAAAMDKDVMKKLFAAAGLPQTPHITLLRSQWQADPGRCRRAIEKALAYPIFVKPANLGSSVGISKVHHHPELAAAMDLAAGFDRKIVVEQGVGGPAAKPRELEVAVLGNDSPEASVVGEIIPAKEFLRLRSQVPAQRSRRKPRDHPCRLVAKRTESHSHHGTRGLPRLRLRRPRPGRLSHGARYRHGRDPAEQTTHLPQ